MKHLPFLLMIYTVFIFPQEKPVSTFHTPENIKKFADHLFCNSDYLRAAVEYDKYLENYENDTVGFKTALSYLKIKHFDKARSRFLAIKESSGFYDLARAEYLRTFFETREYALLRPEVLIYNESKNTSVSKLSSFSFLFEDGVLPEWNSLSKPFNEEELKSIKNFYNYKTQLPEKDPLLAAIFSAIIPGLGKVYTENYGDALISFLSTSLFSYLTYDNFTAKHNFRGWLFAGLGFFFYAGNVYGSAAAAQIFNINVKINFNSELNIFLNNNNYFIDEPGFCN